MASSRVPAVLTMAVILFISSTMVTCLASDGRRSSFPRRYASRRMVIFLKSLLLVPTVPLKGERIAEVGCPSYLSSISSERRSQKTLCPTFQLRIDRRRSIHDRAE